jgi:hypothetical protein
MAPRLAARRVYIQVCTDDATCLAYVEVLADERPATCVDCLKRAIDHSVGCRMGLTFPPATAVIMNDLGLEKARDGAADQYPLDARSARGCR